MGGLEGPRLELGGEASALGGLAGLEPADEDDDSEEAVVVETEEPDEEEEEIEDLTNLNVPSWTELVAGLYRPPDR